MSESIKTLDNSHASAALIVSALLDYTRATRRAELAKVAALERFERELLTIQRASPEDIAQVPHHHDAAPA